MSWFRRKPKNRRLGHAQVLDVKLRSDQVRANRMRVTAVALGLVFATIVGLYVIWRAGEFTLNRLVYENKSFAVQEIDVRTDGVIAQDQLRRWAGVRIGENLLALDLARVKRDLEMVSMIRSVAVERVLPHTLRLRVTERDPLAEVRVLQPRAGGGVQMAVLQVDADGFVMTQVDPRQRATPATQTNDVLPLITGVNPNELLPGRRLESQQARSALQLLLAFDRSPMSGLVDLQTIDVSAPQVLQVTTSERSQITFSVQDLDQQLRRWREVHDQAARLGKVIVTFDLSVHDSVPLTLIEAGAAPPATPKMKNPQRKGRRNV
ncbi:MAG TPA: FtsQ-type POTRA domain-containing protein [Verrucomicrobiae bacterium]|nr:FtsQ-type POTRA domain-containing protein [Verrucomicrobiae bacterium]